MSVSVLVSVLPRTVKGMAVGGCRGRVAEEFLNIKRRERKAAGASASGRISNDSNEALVLHCRMFEERRADASHRMSMNMSCDGTNAMSGSQRLCVVHVKTNRVTRDEMR